MNKILPNILNSGQDEDTAITIPDNCKINYFELKKLVNETSEKLIDHGAQNEKPIVIVLKNNAEFIITFLAVTNTSAIAAPLNSGFTEEEFNFYLDDINPSMVITTEGNLVIKQAKSKNIAVSIVSFENGILKMDFDSNKVNKKDTNRPNENNSCLFLHTSGTTSRPKGVPLKHKNLLESLKNIVDTYDLKNTDIAMVVMPLFHVHGLIGVALSTLSSGGEIVIPEKFSAGAFWGLQKKHQN